MRVILFVWVFWGSSLVFAIGKEEQPWEKWTLQKGCGIYDFAGDLKKSWPGHRCLFLENGDFISADADGLRLFGPEGELRWKVPGHFHHHMSLSADKKTILALSSVFFKQKENIRFDRLLRVDLRGNIVAEQNAETLFKAVKFKFGKWPLKLKAQAGQAEFETSHFNSIYEVPKNSSSSGQKYLREGAVVANSTRAGVFVLSPDLKEVWGHWIFKHSYNHQIHDVQVTNEGQFLYINNYNADDPKGPYSSVEIWDPVDQKSVFKFTASEKQFYFSIYCGSVQVVDEQHIFFSDYTKGAFVIDRAHGKLLASSFMLSGLDDSGRPATTEQIKVIRGQKP